MSRVTVGTITLPHGVSDKETLLWFHKWIKSSARNITEFSCIIDAIFFGKDDLNNTLKYLQSIELIFFRPNELMTPEGIIVRFTYDEESDEQLKIIRRND